MSKKKPRSEVYEEYEDLTRRILNDERVRSELDLNRVEAYKHKFTGKKTGTDWEVDAFGYDLDGCLVLIECKHYETNKLNQNQLGAFVYTLQDLGAKRGIVVTTLGLQKGAIKVAKAENITLIKLDYHSNNENFTVNLVNKAVIQRTDQFKGISFSPGLAKIKNYSQEELLKHLYEEVARENSDIK
jgi:predicted helicase